MLEQERIDRGMILAADGTVLARSVRGREGTYQRTYPTGELFAHAVGYSYIYPDLGQTGIERYRNAALNGETGTNLQTILDQLQGKKPQGDEVVTTLDPAAQRVAHLRARRAPRCGGGARSAHRRGQGDGLHARL